MNQNMCWCHPTYKNVSCRNQTAQMLFHRFVLTSYEIKFKPDMLYSAGGEGCKATETWWVGSHRPWTPIACRTKPPPGECDRAKKLLRSGDSPCGKVGHGPPIDSAIGEGPCGDGNRVCFQTWPLALPDGYHTVNSQSCAIDFLDDATITDLRCSG